MANSSDSESLRGTCMSRLLIQGMLTEGLRGGVLLREQNGIRRMNFISYVIRLLTLMGTFMRTFMKLTPHILQRELTVLREKGESKRSHLLILFLLPIPNV